MALLSVEGLSVAYRTEAHTLQAAQNVTFTVGEGEAVGLVGESGSGKSTVGRAILRLMPSNGVITQGRVLFRGRDLVRMPDAELRRVRWAEIAMIFQSSMSSLNPMYRVGDQIAEAIRAHEPIGRAPALERSRQLLESVGIDGARWASYPHQLSGGMRQRVNIAMAMALSPSLIIADEPTTALDVVTQDRVLRELRRQQQQRGSSMLIVSHDIGVVAENCQKVAVMYAGRIVEFSATKTMFQAPYHPYTLGLQNAFPDFRSQRELISLPGSPPMGASREMGCPFASRCPFAQDRCASETPQSQQVGPDHWVACHYVDQAAHFRLRARDPATWTEKAG